MKKHSKRTRPYVPAPIKLLLMSCLYIGQRKKHGYAKSECGRGLHKGISFGKMVNWGPLVYKTQG